MSKRAIITGITGQDGSYLAEYLLDKGYEVHGIVRRSSVDNTQNIKRIVGDIFLHTGDLLDMASLTQTVKEVKPDELYNLASQSDVMASFNIPETTTSVGTSGVVNVLESVRSNCPDCRIFQAGTSEMFGNSLPPQSEITPYNPQSPYGCAKVFAYYICCNYRQAYDMFISNGIAFNHESPRRGEKFVTRKISLAVARIKLGMQDKLFLGNLDARRDWGYAPEYVRAMYMMLQSERPDDYVIATGEQHTIKEFVVEAFSAAGLDWRKYVDTKDDLLRPTEVASLCGDASKIRRDLGWVCEVKFDKLCSLMVEHDLNNVRKYENI